LSQYIKLAFNFHYSNGLTTYFWYSIL